MNLPTRPTQEAFLESAADGHPLGGFTWRHPRTDLERPVVIINAATSVRSAHQDRLWPIALAWLQHGQLTADTLGISLNLRFNTPPRS